VAWFVDVLLRGIALLAGGLALGGPMFAWIVLGAGPGTKPDRAAARALRLTAAGASIAAAAQLGIVVASAMAVARNLDGSSLHGFFGTNFARVALLRAGLGAGVAILALRLARRPGGGLLLTHPHAVFDLKEAFLMEVTHAPIGIFGVIAGWARWLEIRLPESAPATGRVWPGCLVAAGLVLLCYSEG
jgi:hypothetical protein